MSKYAWAAPRWAWIDACRIAPLLFLLVAPVAFAERITVNPETQLSLDFNVENVTPCILVPDSAYDHKACAGIPPGGAAPKGTGRNVHALVILKQPERVFVVTEASLSRPGIGEMYDKHIEMFIQSTLKNLSQEFGARTHLVEEKGPHYTIEKMGGVPVVRWEYTTDLPESDMQANTASAVVYLIPSRDTLDFLSINVHQRDLAAARKVGDQLVFTLQVPLTVDAEKFGGDLTHAMELSFVKMLLPVPLALLGIAWLWWRYRKLRSVP